MTLATKLIFIGEKKGKEKLEEQNDKDKDRQVWEKLIVKLVNDEKEEKKSDSKRVASSVHSFLITIHDHAHAYTNREKRNDKGAGG